MLTVILKRTRNILSQERVWEMPGNEATQTSHLHAHLYTNPRSTKLDVNLGASQVIYITYSIVRFLLFSQFVLTIIFVVSLSSGEKTTGKWGHFTLVNIYICVCTCVTMCLCASVYHICVCYITLRYTSLKMTLRFGNHFRCCAATAQVLNAAPEDTNAAPEDTNAGHEKP